MSGASRDAPSGDAAPESGRGRRDPFSLAAVGLAAVHVLVGLLLYEPTLFPGGDNAGYLILGEALRGGEGYRDLYLPGAPLHAKYPPVLPAILALVGAVGGLQLSKLAMLACTGAAVWATARLGRRLVGEPAALVAAGLLALNPTLLEYGHYVLSEAPFTLLILLALLAAGRGDRRGVALAIAAGAGAFLTRTAGLAVLLALPAAWALRGEWRRAAVGASAAAAVMLGWAAFQGWAAPEQAGYLRELALVDPYDPAAGSVGLAGLVARAASNLWAYASGVVPQTLFGPGSVGGAYVPAGLAVSLVFLVGWARSSGRLPGPPEMFVLLYGGLIAIWPSVWTDRRFLLPALPLLLLFGTGLLARGLERVASLRREAGPRGAGGLAAVALALIVAAPGILWSVRTIPGRVSCLASYRIGAPCDPAPNASLYAAARWARENTPDAAVFANRKPRLFYWYSRRAGDLYPYSSDPEVVMRGLEAMGATYVVVDQISGTTARYLMPAIRESPGRFEPVYEGGRPATFILRLLPTPVTAE